MPDLRDRATRRWAPRAVVALSRVTWPARARAAARRAAGRPGVVDLYVAFDDPCSAVALLVLRDRLAGRPVALRVHAVVARGPEGDPATADKRRYAILDARRLARRYGLGEPARDEPLPPASVAFLAAWVAQAPPGPAVTAFCSEALRRLWLDGDDGPVDRDAFAALWRGTVGGEPPPDAAPGAVAVVERRMRRRGPYDTPAAIAGGAWFFAHDRPAQIAERLDLVGWAAA